ncbi:MAG: hypothetical protein K9M15_01095 [Candidatus Marinimicrobia bacterium]|nr:hypothetical protein [Candidatus Neomarinimicrobiota bacterium]
MAGGEVETRVISETTPDKTSGLWGEPVDASLSKDCSAGRILVKARLQDRSTFQCVVLLG